MIVLSSEKVAERVRVGFPQFTVVAVAEEAGPGGRVGGDVRRDAPAGVDLPGLRWKVAQAHGLGGADAACLDDVVLAVHGVDVLRVVAARDAREPVAGDVGAGDGVLPAGLLLVVGQVPQVAAGGPHPPRDPPQAGLPGPGAPPQARDLPGGPAVLCARRLPGAS